MGVGKGATFASGSQMDLSFWHLSNGVTEIRELGVYKGEVTYKAGDIFTIEMTDGRVKYFKNEALIITSYAPYSFPMYGKASMQYLDGRVAGATFFKLYNLDIEPVQTTTTNTESPSSTGDQTGTNSTNTSSQDNTSTPPQEDVIEFPPVDEPETVVVNLKPTGYVDGFDNSKRTVFGWAKDDNVPEGAVDLHFYVDTRAGSGKSPSFTGLANITRSDVGKHGFEVPIPNKYLDGRRHTLYTYAVDINDTSGSSNVLLSAATRRFRMTAPAVTPPPTTTNQAPVGSLDGVDTTRGVVYGWAKDADSESTAVDVHLYFDKNAGTSGTSPILCKADKYRSDVGNHAFDCAIPSTYTDGSSHSVWAWGIDLTNSTNNIQLTGSPKTFTWGTVPAPEPAPEPTPTPPPVVSDSDPIAELPRVYVNTAMVTLGGSTINVPAGGNFQNALESARCGDTIVLAAGATYSGNFVAKNKGCTGNSWIHIRSSGYANLPGPGRRVGPSDAPNMAKIVSPNVGSALLFDFGATNYRVMGLEVAGACSACDSRVYTLYSLVKMGEDENGAKATTLAQLPNNIILDRMYIHGSPTGNYRRAVQLNARAAAVIDSYISDIHEVGADSQAIGGWNGPGPFKISNNYLEAAGENIIFGGADPSGSHMMPQDIEIRNNYLFKPLAWKANNPDWVVKNLFELKLGSRVLVEGNVMENNWTDAQNGFGVLFTVRNQDGTAPYSEVSDVTFRYNRIINSESGINLHASDYNATSQVTRRIDMSNNLFEGITGRVIQTGTSVGTGSDYRFNHNTIVSSGYNNLWSLGDDTSIKYDRFKFNNNIALHGLYGIFGSGTGTGNSALNSYLTNYEVTKNVFVGGGSAGSYPAGNYFVSAYSSVGFVDFNNKNYTLSSSSQYRNAGTDGQDLGFNAPTFYALTNCVVGGTCGGGSGATPAPTSTTVRDGYGDTLSLTKLDGWFYDSSNVDTSAVITYVNVNDSTKTYTQTASRTVNRTDAANWLTQTYGSNLTITQPLGFSVNPSSVVTAPGTYKVQSIKLNSSGTNISLSNSAGGTFTVVDTNPQTDNGEVLSWTSLKNMSVSSGRISKTGGSTDGVYDASAIALKQCTSGDCSIEFTVDQLSDVLWIGFSKDVTNSSTQPSSIDFALHYFFYDTGGFFETYAMESGVYKSETYPTPPGAVLRLAIEGGKVKYYYNGQAFYTSLQAPSYPMVVKVLTNKMGTGVGGVSFGSTAEQPTNTPATVRDGYGDTLSLTKFDGWFYDSTGADTQAVITYVNTSDSTKTYTQTATRTVTRTDAANWLTSTYGSSLAITQPLGFSVNPSSVVTVPGTYRIQSVRLNSSNTSISLSSNASGTFTVAGVAGLPVISSFTATPTYITLGQGAVLNWSVSGATSISIDQGIGDVTSRLSPTVTIAPTSTTTYTLTATNTSGSAKSSVTVTIGTEQQTNQTYDTAPYTVYSVPTPPALPAVGGVVNDPTFGTPIMRITGNGNSAHGYSYWLTFNVNSTKLYVHSVAGVPTVYDFDPVNFKLLSTGKEIFRAGACQSEDAIWSNTDPNIIFCHDLSGNIRTYNVVTDQWQLIKATGKPGNQWSKSDDDKKFAWTWQDANYQPIGYVVYDRTTDTVTSFSATSMDEVQIDKSGRYLVYKTGQQGAGVVEVKVVDLQTGAINDLIDDQDYAPGHSDNGYGKVYGADNWKNRILGRSLATPKQWQQILQLPDWSQANHISALANDESQILISNFTGNTLSSTGQLNDEVFLVKTDGSGAVKHLFHHFSKFSSYWDSPRANISRDGQFVTFTSTWGRASGTTDVFVAKISGSAGTGTPTPTPDPTPATVRDGYGDTLSLTKFDGWFYDSTGADTQAVITYVNTSDSTKTYTQTATRTVTRTDAANWLTTTYGSNLVIAQPLGFSVNPSSVVTAPGTYKVQSIKLNSSNANIALSSSASGTFTVATGNTGGAVLSNQVTINTATQNQTITGWEATAQAWQMLEQGTSSQYSTNDNPAFAQYRNALFDHMVNVLGITRLRVEMHSGVENPTDYFSQFLNKQLTFSQYFSKAYEIINDNTSSTSINSSGFKFASIDHQIDKVLLPVKSRVEARGDKFHFNLCYVDFGTSSFEHYNDPNEYAELMLAFFQHSQSKYGFVPDTIELVLEPDNTPWNGTRLGQAMQATQTKLATAGFTPKFVLPSVTNIANAVSYFDAARSVVGDSFISSHVKEFSYHRYGGATSSQLSSVASRATQLGVGTSHLEYIGANVDNLFDDLGVANNSAWAQFTIAWPTSDGSDDGGKYYLIDGSGQVVVGTRTMSLAQVMNYVRPGARRVGATSNQGGLKTLGFTNSNGKEVVVVKNNIGSTSFSVLGLSSGTYGISYVRDGQTTRTTLSDVTITAGQSVNVTMPGGGTATVYKK